MSLKKNIINGTLWSVGGQLISLMVVLVTNVWLARILGPEEFGKIGVVMFFIVICNVLTESGMVGALVRKNQITNEDYSTAFIFNLIISLICFSALVSSSGLIADYYNDPQFQPLLIVSAFILIIGAFQIIQNAKIMRDLKFKQRSFYNIISISISSVVGIIMAYKDYGVWSLVVIQILNALFYTILLWVFEGFYMEIIFSKKSFKELYSFGVNTTLSSLLNTAFDNIYQLILAKNFSLNQVGFYYQAKKIQDVPGGLLNIVAQNVVFSNLTKLQDDKDRFISAFDRINLYFLVGLGFISCFVYVYSNSIIQLLFGVKWLGAVFYMKILTIASFFYFAELINRVVFKIFNKTKQILYLEIVKKVIQTISIIIGIITFNIEVLIIGFALTSFISYWINYYYTKRILDGMKWDEILTICKIIILSFIIIMIFTFANSYFNLSFLACAFTLPIMIIAYLLGINSLNILNLKNEYINLKSK